MRKAVLTAVCAGALCLGTVARANVTPIEISLDPTSHTPSDVQFNSITGNPTDNFSWLQGEITSYNTYITPNPLLPPPTTGFAQWDNLNGSITITVSAGDYIVEHYGVGQDGIPGTGGGLVAYYANVAGNYVVPASGPGPNGKGGLSYVYLWDHTGDSVPEGGATVALLGIALAGLGWMRRLVMA